MKTAKYKKKNKGVEERVYDPTKTKVGFKFDKDILNMFIGYIFSSDSKVTKLNLANLEKLIDITNMRPYELDTEKFIRIKIIKDALDAKLHKGLNKPEMIKIYCQKANDEDVSNVISHIDEYSDLSRSEIDFITNKVADALQYSFIMYWKDIIVDSFMSIDQGDYDSLKDVVSDVKAEVMGLMTEMRKIDNVNNMNTFSLEDGVFEQFIEDTVRHASDPNNALMTGIRMLNQMLSPGFLPGRLYLTLACTGVYKSSFLLYVAYWIKKYNKVVPRRREASARPTVVLFVLENDIEETLIRLFNMSVSTNDITKYTPQEAIKLMRERGELQLNDGDIDIVIKYYQNNSLSPNDLYSIIDTLEDDGREVIACIIDYIKRMRADEPAPDERIKLRNISNGLKDLAIHYKIPIITAQQLNRSGNMTIDAAAGSGKEDLARFLGRANISDAWDLLENADWSAILNVEVERQSHVRYLTIKEIKKRYKSMTDTTYFNHPFQEGSTIMLIDDVPLEESISKISIASDMTADNMVEPKRNHANNSDLIDGLTMGSGDINEVIHGKNEGIKYVKKKKHDNETVLTGIPA
jgi:hypothetical protein